jgi:hypothetical protein
MTNAEQCNSVPPRVQAITCGVLDKLSALGLQQPSKEKAPEGFWVMCGDYGTEANKRVRYHWSLSELIEGLHTCADERRIIDLNMVYGKEKQLDTEEHWVYLRIGEEQVTPTYTGLDLTEALALLITNVFEPAP